VAGPYLSANGHRVTSVDLWIPYYGAPVADVTMADASILANPITLVVGNLSLRMALQLDTTGQPRQAAFAGSSTARLVGGYGGWQRTIAVAPYRNPKGVMLSRVLSDVAMATGSSASTRERVTLASGLDRSLGLFYAPESNAPAGRLLMALAGPLWWIDTLGVTQIASARPARAITSTTAPEVHDMGGGRLLVATEDPAAWLPGATYSSPTVPTSIAVRTSKVKASEDGRMRVEVLTQ
jgi:hypothetical protein